MKYVLEDTIDGYRVSLQRADGTVVHAINEEGGHGPVEAAYLSVSRTYTDLRAREVNAVRIGDV